MIKNIKFLILLAFLIIFSQSLFAFIPITGEEYVKKVRELKPSKNIQSLLQDTKTGAGYVEVRGEVVDIFEFGANKYFTLHLNNSRYIDYIYVNLPENTDPDDIQGKSIACILKWDILSLNQDIVQTIQLNQDDHYDIESFSYLIAVTEYEEELASKSKIHTYGTQVNFVMPRELSTDEEINENPNKYNVSSTGRSKVYSIIKSVNNSLSDSLALAYADFIISYSLGHGVDPIFTCAIITAESRFKNSATSRVGAQGLGQLMPRTCKGLGVSNAYDPQQNIYGTTKYLKNAASILYKKYPKELTFTQLKCLAASYNAGPGAVKKYGGIPPYNETRNYVVKVLNNYIKFLNS